MVMAEIFYVVFVQHACITFMTQDIWTIKAIKISSLKHIRHIHGRPHNLNVVF